MTTPSILPAGRRSREENRARRAWASAHNRRAPVALQLLGNLLPVLDSPTRFTAISLDGHWPVAIWRRC